MKIPEISPIIRYGAPLSLALFELTACGQPSQYQVNQLRPGQVDEYTQGVFPAAAMSSASRMLLKNPQSIVELHGIRKLFIDIIKSSPIDREITYERNGHTWHLFLQKDVEAPTQQELDTLWDIAEKRLKFVTKNFEATLDPVTESYMYLLKNDNDKFAPIRYQYFTQVRDSGFNAADSLINMDEANKKFGDPFAVEFVQTLLMRHMASNKPEEQKTLEQTSNMVGLAVEAAKQWPQMKWDEYIQFATRSGPAYFGTAEFTPLTLTEYNILLALYQYQRPPARIGHTDWIKKQATYGNLL